MKKCFHSLVLCSVLVLSTSLSAVAEDGHDHADHSHMAHGHDITGVELAVSVGYVHLDEEDEDAVGVHAHALKRVGSEGLLRSVAVGGGAEYIFSDEEHYALMFTLAVYPWRDLMLAVSPGVQWAEHEGSTESEYSTHIEASYAFPVGAYDIGPVFDYSWTEDESHYMVGLHFGIHL